MRTSCLRLASLAQNTKTSAVFSFVDMFNTLKAHSCEKSISDIIQVFPNIPQ